MEDHPVRFGVRRRFGKVLHVISLEKGIIQQSLFLPSAALATALKLFSSSHSPMDFPQAHDSVISGLICPIKNTDAHFWEQSFLLTCSQERQSWPWLLISLIPDLTRSKGLLPIYGLFGLNSDHVNTKGLRDCIQSPSKTLYN